MNMQVASSNENSQTNVNSLSVLNKEMHQYITFTVGEEDYGITILAVREIKGWIDTTRLPNTPDWMRGVINLRGVILPIVDLRARFGMGMTEPTKTHVVIIASVGERLFGLLVDGVSDIALISPEQIQPIPDMQRSEESQFLQGLVSVKEKMVAMLDLEKLIRGLGSIPMPDFVNEQEAIAEEEI